MSDLFECFEKLKAIEPVHPPSIFHTAKPKSLAFIQANKATLLQRENFEKRLGEIHFALGRLGVVMNSSKKRLERLPNSLHAIVLTKSDAIVADEFFFI